MSEVPLYAVVDSAPPPPAAGTGAIDGTPGRIKTPTSWPRGTTRGPRGMMAGAMSGRMGMGRWASSKRERRATSSPKRTRCCYLLIRHCFFAIGHQTFCIRYQTVCIRPQTFCIRHQSDTVYQTSV